ncbi:MAG: hypothetical protein K0R82_847 [Flavipsychrobacter sp.]|jgi:hypothetical protein|nr:hypothetical protein [Flavipsychrobacter sp.]
MPDKKRGVIVMQTYFFLFSRNEILSYSLVHFPPDFEGDLSYKSTANYLVSAYVRAYDEASAKGVVADLLEAFVAAR